MTDMENVVQAGAYLVSCPECGAKPGEACVYIWPKGINPGFVHNCTLKQQARVALVGKPTKRPHNGRLNLVSQKRRRRSRRTHEMARSRPSSDMLAVARAHVEFDRREFQQLREWFASNGQIFREKGSKV